MTKYLSILILLFSFMSSYSQNPDKMVRKGNKQYENKSFVDAEVNYKRALEVEPNKEQGIFNLGSAYYKQERYDEAIKQYEISSTMLEEKDVKSGSFHNLGNAYLESFLKENTDQQKKMKYLDQSIEAYKNALKINPNDYQTKYNLSYALKHKQNMQNGGGQNEQQQEQKEQEKKEQEQKQKQQQQQQKDNMSQEQAKQILKALQNEEKEVQEKLMKKKQQATKVKIEKEW